MDRTTVAGVTALLVGLLALLPGQDPTPAPAVRDFQGYRRAGTVLDVHDGDTIRAQLDIWDGVHVDVSIRILGIDAPELQTNPHGPADPPDAIASRNYLRGLLADRTVYVVPQVDRNGSIVMTFGRVVAALYTLEGDSLASVGDRMVAAGYAKPYPDPAPPAVRARR